MRARVAASIIAALGICTGAAGAQDEIVSGTRVRVRVEGTVDGDIVATVLSRTADSLVLGGPNMQPLRVAMGKLSSIEVSRGKSRSHGAVAGMKWGVPIAVGAMALGPEDRVLLMIGGLSGALYGAGIGALIGKEKWERLETTTRTSLIMHQGRPRLGMSLSF